jgi:hypothetical protein
MDDHEIRDALGKTVPAPAPTPDTFEAILRRAQRGRARLLGIALVVALVGGPAAGVLVGLNIDDGGKPVTVASGDRRNTRRDAATPPPPTATASGSASEARVAPFLGGESKLVQLFTRTAADGISIRAYRADLPSPDATKGIAQTSGQVPCPQGATCSSAQAMPVLPDECSPVAILRAELSNEAAVEPGFLSISKLGPDQAVAVIQASYFGVQEGSPAAWVAVHTSDAVAIVRVRFADGTVDQMAPVQGYAVLAHQTAPPAQPDPSADPEAFRKSMLPEGTVEALDGAGSVVATAALTDAGAPRAACMETPLPTPLLPDGAPPGAGAVGGGQPTVTLTVPAPPVTTAR